jgi:hypothetical protein
MDPVITARITGFDMNCSKCILEFPDDNLFVKAEIGESQDNFYEALNLDKTGYEIGQMLRVKIRKAHQNESVACITLYPSYNYKNIIVTEKTDFGNLRFNDTIDLDYKDCLYDAENHSYICFDSVLTDSRCPTGTYCFWEGNAEVRFKLEKLNEPDVQFNLNTFMRFRTDTVMGSYKITLTGLKPFPSSKHPVGQKDYTAQIRIDRIK